MASEFNFESSPYLLSSKVSLPVSVHWAVSEAVPLRSITCSVAR